MLNDFVRDLILRRPGSGPDDARLDAAGFYHRRDEGALLGPLVLRGGAIRRRMTVRCGRTSMVRPRSSMERRSTHRGHSRLPRAAQRGAATERAVAAVPARRVARKRHAWGLAGG